MKIPIKYVIDSGAWFKYHGENISCGQYCGPVDFRFRVLSFDMINLNYVDESEKFNRDYNPLSEGNYWIMKVEIVNLTKIILHCSHLSNMIVVLDQDGFEFSTADWPLLSDSEYAEKSGLYDLPAFMTPKIKYIGAIAYFLPKEDGTEYFLSVNSLEGGNIQEV